MTQSLLSVAVESGSPAFGGRTGARSGTGGGGLRPTLLEPGARSSRLETAGQWQPPEEDTGLQPSPGPSKDVLRAFTCLGQVLRQVLAPGGQAWGSEGPVGKSCPPPVPGDPSHTLLGGLSPACSPDPGHQGPEWPECGLAGEERDPWKKGVVVITAPQPLPADLSSMGEEGGCGFACACACPFLESL